MKPLLDESFQPLPTELPPVKSGCRLKSRGKGSTSTASKRRHPDADVSNFVPATTASPPPSPVRTRAAKKKKGNGAGMAAYSTVDRESNTGDLGVDETLRIVEEKGCGASSLSSQETRVASIPIAEGTISRHSLLSGTSSLGVSPPGSPSPSLEEELVDYGSTPSYDDHSSSSGDMGGLCFHSENTTDTYALLPVSRESSSDDEASHSPGGVSSTARHLPYGQTTRPATVSILLC